MIFIKRFFQLWKYANNKELKGLPLQTDFMNYRLNQRLCKVKWRKGIPYLHVGTITKVTQTTYHMDNAKKPSLDWSICWRDAITQEYRELIHMWASVFGESEKKEDALRKRGWTYAETVRCICKVRRLEQNMRWRKHRKQ